jgi:hypothetical protein
MIDLDEAEQIARKVTSGEWGAGGSMVVTPPRQEQMRRIDANEFPFTSKRICDCENDVYLTAEEVHANSEFIAYARNHWQEMVDEIRELRAENERVHNREARLREQLLNQRHNMRDGGD